MVTLNLVAVAHGQVGTPAALSDELLQRSQDYRRRPEDAAVRLRLAQALQIVEPLQRVLAAPCSEVMALGFGLQGARLHAVCRDGQVLQWSGDGQVQSRGRLPGGPYLAAQFSEDAATLQALRQDGVLLTWDVQAVGRIRQRNLGRPGLRCADFREDGKLLFTCGPAGGEFFDPESGQRVSQIKAQEGSGAIPRIVDGWWSSASEKLVAVDATGTLMLWLPRAGHAGYFRARPEVPARLRVEYGLEEHERAPVVVGEPPQRVWSAYVTDPWAKLSAAPLWIRRSAGSAGRNLIAAASPDGQVEIFMRDSGARLAVLGGHPGTVVALRFHPQGTALATAGRDGTVRLWQLLAGMRLRGLPHPDGPVSSAVFSSDGRQVLTQVESGPTRIWDAATGQARSAVAARGGGVTLWAGREGALAHLGCGLPFRQICERRERGLQDAPPQPTDLTQWLMWQFSLAGTELAPRGQLTAPFDLSINPSADGQRLLFSTGHDAPLDWLRRWSRQTQAWGDRAGDTCCSHPASGRLSCGTSMATTELPPCLGCDTKFGRLR